MEFNLKTAKQLWKIFKEAFSLGQKADNVLGASDGLADRLFKQLHPNDPRSTGEAIYKEGDREYRGKHTPSTEASGAGTNIQPKPTANLDPNSTVNSVLASADNGNASQSPMTAAAADPLADLSATISAIDAQLNNPPEPDAYLQGNDWSGTFVEMTQDHDPTGFGQDLSNVNGGMAVDADPLSLVPVDVMDRGDVHQPDQPHVGDHNAAASHQQGLAGLGGPLLDFDHHNASGYLSTDQEALNNLPINGLGGLDVNHQPFGMGDASVGGFGFDANQGAHHGLGDGAAGIANVDHHHTGSDINTGPHGVDGAPGQHHDPGGVQNAAHDAGMHHDGGHMHGPF